jgi:hypothetical protein
MRMIVEQLMEWRLAGETEVLRENLPQRHFVHQKILHDQTRARTQDRHGGKPVTNHLGHFKILNYYLLGTNYTKQ